MYDKIIKIRFNLSLEQEYEQDNLDEDIDEQGKPK